jgi:hypothetical protein
MVRVSILPVEVTTAATGGPHHEDAKDTKFGRGRARGCTARHHVRHFCALAVNENASIAVSLSAHTRRRLFLFWRRFIVVALAVYGVSVAELKGAEPTAVSGPLFHEATNEFAAMTSTGYQHKTQVDSAAGSYHYDCVGFISYALKRAASQAWATTANVTGIARGRIPSPPQYRAFFASLTEKPQPGWDAVAKASELRPGDVVAWEHKTETAVGHAVVIGGTPSPMPDGEWLVEVYDSTSSPHSDDSRSTDQRAQMLASTGRRSGLGHGVMVFIADPISGALTGFRWSPKAKAITVPIAAGRPTS